MKVFQPLGGTYGGLSLTPRSGNVPQAPNFGLESSNNIIGAEVRVEISVASKERILSRNSLTITENGKKNWKENSRVGSVQNVSSQ